MSPKINDQSQEPFVRYHEKKKADTISVKLNSEERAMIQDSKLILEQAKDSTVLKQLAVIGYESITRGPTARTINILFKNKRKNKRTGIAESEFLIDKSKS